MRGTHQEDPSVLRNRAHSPEHRSHRDAGVAVTELLR